MKQHHQVQKKLLRVGEKYIKTNNPSGNRTVVICGGETTGVGGLGFHTDKCSTPDQALPIICPHHDSATIIASSECAS